MKGTMFRGIYRPYKNYTPRLPTPPDEKSAMMQEVNKYAFAAHDILLYLDNFPNDQEAINLYNGFMEAYLRARDAYEERFGAITTESDALKTAPFSWTVGGWPWVRGT
ncbi:MAG: spore coat protein CotJB [Bacilli bacterium]